MSVIDDRMRLYIGPADSADADCGGCCGSCERADAQPDPDVPVGFDTAISMAEAAANRNPGWWNEIRTHDPDPAAGEYCSSILLGVLLESAAHRVGVPAADIWSHIRRTGELPL